MLNRALDLESAKIMRDAPRARGLSDCLHGLYWSNQVLHVLDRGTGKLCGTLYDGCADRVSGREPYWHIVKQLYGYRHVRVPPSTTHDAVKVPRSQSAPVPVP